VAGFDDLQYSVQGTDFEGTGCNSRIRFSYLGRVASYPGWLEYNILCYMAVVGMMQIQGLELTLSVA
jgi:hypothetical protein